jgi:hypothetical protein
MSFHFSLVLLIRPAYNAEAFIAHKLKNSSGVYITVIDADDIWFPQKWEVVS